MEELVTIMVPLGICMVLPLGITALIVWEKRSKDNNRKEILLSALEKNPNVDIEELLKKFNPPTELIKEKLLKKLLWGMIFLFAGIGLIVTAIVAGLSGGWTSDTIYGMAAWGAAALAVGIGLLANYNIGRKMLDKEMEAELKNLESKQS